MAVNDDDDDDDDDNVEVYMIFPTGHPLNH